MPVIAAFMVPHPPMIVPEVGRGSESQVQKTIRAYEKVAEELGLQSPRVIYEWTNGNKLPSLVRLVNLSVLLGVHIEDLLEIE